MSGLFIAFEGGDGAGKSTQSGLLKETLQRQGYRTVLLREPGSTSLGNYLRQYLVDRQPISSLAELFLFEASRAELMTQRIRPQLDAGAVIIADRFAGSTIAYQGYGRGIDLNRIECLNNFATGGRYPDLTILLDIDPTVGISRVKGRQLELGLLFGDAADRFDDEAMPFHDRVRRGFLQQANANPENWRPIEANRSISDVAASVWAVVRPLLAARNPAQPARGIPD